MLVAAQRSALQRELLEHAAPVVRIECLQEILALATVPDTDPATPGSFRARLREAARAFLAEHSIGVVVTSVLRAPAAPSLELSEGGEAPADTYERAANAVFIAAHHGYPIDDLTVDLVAELLHTTRRRRFHAAWALSAIIHHTPARGLALGERLEKVRAPLDSEGPVRTLLHSVAALLLANPGARQRA